MPKLILCRHGQASEMLKTYLLDGKMLIYLNKVLMKRLEQVKK